MGVLLLVRLPRNRRLRRKQPRLRVLPRKLRPRVLLPPPYPRPHPFSRSNLPRCLTSYCPSNTPGICQASLGLAGLCAAASGAPVASLTGISCATDTSYVLASLLPTNMPSALPSETTSEGASETGAGVIGAAPVKGAGSGGGRVGSFEELLAAGVVVSVAVGMVAAWL